jgi:hypothetical protein
MATLESTKTYELYQNLIKAGFKTSQVFINTSFDYSYNRDNHYASIIVEDIHQLDLNLLFKTVKQSDFDILLGRMAEGNFIYEIRKPADKAEFTK